MELAPLMQGLAHTPVIAAGRLRQGQRHQAAAATAMDAVTVAVATVTASKNKRHHSISSQQEEAAAATAMDAVTVAVAAVTAMDTVTMTAAAVMRQLQTKKTPDVAS